MPSEKPQPKEIEKLRKKYPEARERQELKVWHYHMIAKKYVYGKTWKEVGEEFGKSAQYLSRIANSPAGKEFRAKIENMEPEQVAEATIKAASVDATHDFMIALEWAKEARDYKAVRKMTKDLLEFADVGDKGGGDGGGQTIVLNLDASSLESPEVETDYQELEAEVIDEGG